MSSTGRSVFPARVARWLIIAHLGLAVAVVPAWALKGKVKDGVYSSKRGWFSLKVPESSNWAGVPFKIKDASIKKQANFELVMFHVADFGEVLLASERHLHDAIRVEMDKDEPRTVLKKSSFHALYDWRQSFPAEPEVKEESFVQTKHGEALLRVFRVKEGALLTAMSGGQVSTPDASIAVMVARKGDRMLWVIAEDDSSQGGDDALKITVKEFFDSITLNPR